MRSWSIFGAGMLAGVLIASLAANGSRWFANAWQTSSFEAPLPDGDELSRLFHEDQADRSPGADRAIDWDVVLPRDRQREARVKALNEAGKIRTGKDYYRAAMVLQHASQPTDFLLAHEFCLVALSRGERAARWLAAATEDRYLMNSGQPQRFGTQYRSNGTEPVHLYEVSPGVNDGVRRALDVPTLAEAKQREAEMNAMIRAQESSPERGGSSRPPG